MLDKLFSYAIKSDYVRAIILAQVRHLVTALGVSLVAKGYADSASVEQLAGLAVTLASFWLAQSDVKNVDKKIQTALETPVLPQTEEEETKSLNKNPVYKYGSGVNKF